MKTTGIIFDFNRTLFDPTVYRLYSGVIPMLEELRVKYPLILFSKKGWDRTTLLRELGIVDYFAGTYFVDTKTTDKLTEILKTHALDASSTVIVGDMLNEEIRAGADLGMTTVWFQQSAFGMAMHADTDCIPHHTVSSIAELRDLLRSME